VNLTPRQRVQRALLGRPVDRRPFTVYENKLPRSAVERELRNKGLCVVDRTINVLRVHRPDVQAVSRRYVRNGNCYVRTDYTTPVGNLHTIYREAGFTQWCEKPLFWCRDDYKALKFLADNEQYEPNYKAFVDAQRRAGEDVFFRAGIGSEPLQAIINWMGTERFCLEWMDRRDEVLRLYDALVDAARRRYKLLADSPALAFNYGGNVMADVIGRDAFEKYYLPNYNEAAEALHRQGKLIGSHFDGNCKLIADLIASSRLDYIEAFTPAPDTDMTLDDAIAAWPEKCLWINFPSSVHLAPPDQIARTTRQLLQTARNHRRFLIGITEDVPEDRWQGNFLTIMEAIESWAEEHGYSDV